MSKDGKRYRSVTEGKDRQAVYDVDEAIGLVRGSASARFDETVDVAINLGVDAKKTDQSVRGSTVLPRGTGKTVRVAVFADGGAADVAREEINFDICIATPATMRVVGKLGQILGPRGLMPNPKVGTVTQDVGKAVSNAKAGQVQFRLDKGGVIHCPIGKASFEPEALKENLLALMGALHRAKPSAAKGQYVRRITLSTTMGPGVKVDRASVAS